MVVQGNARRLLFSHRASLHQPGTASAAMHGDFSGRRVNECRFGAQLTVKLTKWVGASMWHSRRTASAASTLALLVLGFLFTSATAAILTSSSTVSLDCSVGRLMTLNADDRWQEVEVNATDNAFIGQCVVAVNFTSSITASLETFVTGQPAVLVKVYKLQILPVGSQCSTGNITLDIHPLENPVGGNRICDEYANDSLYIWVGKPIQLYLYVWPEAYTRSSFSVSFGVVRSVNICLLPSIDVKIKEFDVYTFAPDSVFADLLLLSTSCNGSRQLRITAANSLCSLTMTVLAAPTNPGCWSLLLNDVHVGGLQTQRFAPGANVSLHYNRTNGCITSGRQRGFTIKWSAVAPAPTVASTLITAAPATYGNLSDGTYLVSVRSTCRAAVPTVYTSLPGGTYLKGTSEVSVVVGSAVAALVVLAAVLVVATLLVIRRRRTTQHRNSLRYSRPPQTTSVLNLVDTDVASTMNSEQPEPHRVMPPQHPQSLPFAEFSISSPVAQEIGVDQLDIVMTDNDLYSTSFGS